MFTKAISLAGICFALSGAAFAQVTTAPQTTNAAADETTETIDTAQVEAAEAAIASQGALGNLLKDLPKPAGPEADSFYGPVPPELDKGVRMIAMDNFTSAVIELLPEYEKLEKDSKERARAAMWLGIATGLHAINYPNSGWEQGTSATAFLREAMYADPNVIEAPDACRIFAEMVAHGWGTEDPALALNRAEQKAEETRRPFDFYFAGVISRRLSARAWGYSDTTEQDKKTLSLFAKALARNPNVYELWSAYLPALLPAGLHDLATSESASMYQHFENLRTPLLADQGPAVTMINISSYRTMQQNEDFLNEIQKRWPDAPMPEFETAMRAIETTPPLALELFPKLLKGFEEGRLKPTAREAGYYVSALYKYAFLLQSVDKQDEAIEYYKKVRELSPGYAEVNMNIGILLAQQSDKETTGPKKLALMQEALKYVEIQEKWDYRGKAALKADEMRQRLRSVIYRTKLAMKDEQTSGSAK